MPEIMCTKVPGAGGHRRKMYCGAALPAGVLGQGWACGRITHDRKMQREGLGACDGSELYFETKHNSTEKCTMGSRARAGSGARPGSEQRPAAAGSFLLTPALGLRSLRKNGYVQFLCLSSFH